LHWFIIILIGLASSLDNFAVGLTYGTQGKRITRSANGWIALTATLISLVALAAGRLIGFSIPGSLTGLCGGLLILLIGVWSLIESFKHRRQSSKTIPEAERVDRDHNNLITSREVVWLSFALSFNALGTAFGAGVGGMDPLSVAIFIGLLSYLSIASGQWMGLKSVRTPLGHVSEVTASVLLIAIGIVTMFSLPL
jgi:Predicted membrane protein